MRIPLEPDKMYHIYNHANGNDNLFYSEDNYLSKAEIVNNYLGLYMLFFILLR